jgi:AraC-like DNA-binding protein
MLADKRCTHLNIAQIAHESGFGDVSYFHRVFRRHALRLPGSGKAIEAGAGVSNEMSA